MAETAYLYNGEEHTLNIKSDISVMRKASFVKTVCDLLVTDGIYLSILRPTVFYFCVGRYFTDDEMFRLAGADIDLDALEDFFNNSGFIGIVKASIEKGVLDELDTAVDDAVASKTGVYPNHAGRAVKSLIQTIAEKVNTFDFTAAELNRLISEVGKLK